MSTDNKTSETVITVLNTTKPITLGYLNSENIINAKNSNNDIDTNNMIVDPNNTNTKYSYQFRNKRLYRTLSIPNKILFLANF